ncbi:hypothetical protein BDW68DRAFT_179122 [Aspergillus falconensis]
MTNTNSFDVAVVGGGIVGLITTLGLLRRGISVKLYEQASNFHEIGAGVAFTANAQKCMELLDPRVLQAMRNVMSNNPADYYRYADGYGQPATNGVHKENGINNENEEKRGAEKGLLFQIYAGEAKFDACHRAHLLDELVRVLPKGLVQFRKRLETYVDDDEQEKVLLKFTDGSTAEADVVIGCDGIKSRVRQAMFGAGNPVSYAHYTHKVAFRGLIGMDDAVAVLGRDRAWNQCMHMGPKAHLLHFPVAQHTMINVVAFVDDPLEWPVEEMSVVTSRAEAAEAFANWNPTVRALIGLLPEQLTKWAIFDTYDYPAPTYSRGRVCMAGDAAHASSPHHGAGAGFGVEDALALATVLNKAGSDLRSSDVVVDKATALKAALQAYSTVRLERTQWLVQSARQVCDVYEWSFEGVWDDPDKCKQEIEWRSNRIWYFEIEQMLQEVETEYRRRI